MEDYLTHKCVKNSGEKPQYFVEDDHDPIVPKAVFYQVQGEKKRRSGLASDPSKLRFGNRLALNGRLICGKCGRSLKRYVKADVELTDWRCRQRALVKKTDFHENVESRCDCRIVREVEVQRAVVMAFNTLPSRREELVVQRERLLTGEIGRIDALLKTLDGQQDRLEERLEVLAAAVPKDGEAINTTVVDEVGSTQVITSEMDEAVFLRSQIVEISRTRYTVPEGVLDENGQMERFNNDLVIRYLDRVVVQDDGYEVAFKAGVKVQVEV